MSMSTSYACTHIYIEDMRTKMVKNAVTSEKAFLVKIANNNVMLHEFRWYSYFVAQEQLMAFEASKLHRS